MPSREVDLGRLCAAMYRSRQALKRYREERREAVRQYVGRHWSERAADKKVPINLISLYISIVGRNLIAKNPRVMFSTFDPKMKAFVNAMEAWANKEIENLNLANTIQRVVVDALFSIGITKVALATPADAAVAGWSVQAGQPVASRVDLDDFVYDIHARDFIEAGYMAHRYRVPLDVIKDSKMYSKARKKLEPSSDTEYNLEGDERINVLGRGFYEGNGEEFEDFVDLWEVYVPRHRAVFTLADDQLSGAVENDKPPYTDALRVQSWLGPQTGPYHILSFGPVPGNAMPKGPIQDLIDLHELTNQLYRKLMSQAERQKEILAVQGGATEDGNRIMDASDGQVIRVDNPEKAQTHGFGGPNQQNFAMFVDAIQRFSYMAGNLDMMGGLSPQSKTLGQDKMLEENASHTVTSMQDDTVNYVSSVLKAMAWYWWHDPQKVMTTLHPLPGLQGKTLLRRVTPQQRAMGRFEDHDIRVDPYSMQHSTPKTRASALMNVVQSIIIPMAQQLQSQGVMFDANKFLTILAKYQDMPDLSEIITLQEPPQQTGSTGGGGSSDDAPGMPQSTTRNYVRQSMPGRTPAGDSRNMVNTLMGVNPGGGSAGNGRAG